MTAAEGVAVEVVEKSRQWQTGEDLEREFFAFAKVFDLFLLIVSLPIFLVLLCCAALVTMTAILTDRKRFTYGFGRRSQPANSTT